MMIYIQVFLEQFEYEPKMYFYQNPVMGGALGARFSREGKGASGGVGKNSWSCSSSTWKRRWGFVLL